MLPLAAAFLALASLSLVARERRGIIPDLLITGLIGSAAFGWGAAHDPLLPVPQGVPEQILRGAVDSHGPWHEAGDLSVAHEGRWHRLSGRFLISGRDVFDGGFVARGFVVPLGEPRLPGLADRERAAAWRGLRGRIQVKEIWTPRGVQEIPALEGLRARARAGLARRVGRSLPNPVRSFIPMLIWGESGEMDSEIQRIFRSTGTMHLLAISGLHVSLIALLLEFLLRICVRGVWIRTVLVFAALGCYGFVVGPLPSVVRSIVMASCFMVSRALGRSGAISIAWWFSLLVTVILTPEEVPRPGLQLSFAGTAALILCPRVPGRFLPLVGSCVAVSVTSGILWAHFGESAPMAILANLTGIPAFAPVLVSVLWGLLWGDPGGQTLQALAWGPARFFTASWLGPLTLLLPAGEATIVRASPGEAVGLVSTSMLLTLLWLLQRPARWWVRSCWIGACVLALAGPAILLPAQRNRPRAEIEAAVLPVGQGDATLLRTRDGHAYLVDVGPGGRDSIRGRRGLAPALRFLGVRRLRGVFLTHGDEDHVGALRGLLLAGIRTDTLYLSMGDETRLLLPRRSIPPVRIVRAGWERRDGSLLIRVLAPLTDRQLAKGNDGSLVLRVEGPEGSLLLPGDIGMGEESRLVGSGRIEEADLLLAAHHGSGGSTGEAWCDAVRPSIVLISCGPRNPHGHPARPTLRRLAGRGIEVHRTDREGMLRVRWDRGTVRLQR